MAKDKGKKDKSSKADKPSKSKGSDEFARPSEAPANVDGFKLESEDNIGELMLITPLREETVKGFNNQDAVVIVADVVVLNRKKPEKSVEHENVFVFGGWTKGALRGFIGERRVLGVLGQDASKSKSSNPAWVLNDADDDDIDIATAYLASVDPFAQKGKGK